MSIAKIGSSWSTFAIPKFPCYRDLISLTISDLNRVPNFSVSSSYSTKAVNSLYRVSIYLSWRASSPSRCLSCKNSSKLNKSQVVVESCSKTCYSLSWSFTETTQILIPLDRTRPSKRGTLIDRRNTHMLMGETIYLNYTKRFHHTIIGHFSPKYGSLRSKITQFPTFITIMTDHCALFTCSLFRCETANSRSSSQFLFLLRIWTSTIKHIIYP